MRISRDEQIKSLKNSLDWENVGKRHEVEQTLNSKVMQLDETTMQLQSTEERLRSLESKNRILAGKLSKERSAREEAEQSFTALKAEAEQKMAAAFEESERTTTMYQAQNSQLQNIDPAPRSSSAWTPGARVRFEAQPGVHVEATIARQVGEAFTIEVAGGIA